MGSGLLGAGKGVAMECGEEAQTKKRKGPVGIPFGFFSAGGQSSASPRRRRHPLAWRVRKTIRAGHLAEQLAGLSFSSGRCRALSGHPGRRHPGEPAGVEGAGEETGKQAAGYSSGSAGWFFFQPFLASWATGK